MEELLNIDIDNTGEINDADNEFNSSEIDNEAISYKDFESFSVLPMDLSIELILEWNKKGKLILNPDFQRREVWDIKRMSLFIESLILSVPIPSILLADDKKRNKLIVIDGKQRLNTIIKFCTSDNKGFKLKGLTILHELEGFTYKKMLEDGSKTTYLSKFQNAILKSSVAKNYSDDLLYFIFTRLNNGSVPLSTQELRQALYPGKFVNFVNEFSYQNENIMKVLGLKKPDKRMKDSELVVRYFAFKYFINNYASKINDFFNMTCDSLNRDWDEREEEIKRDAEELNNAIKFIFLQFGNDAFRAYFIDDEGNEKFGPINRPMFDLMTVVFSIPKHREKVVNSSINLKEFLINLFKTNSKFADSFVPTTHSKEKTNNRSQEFLKEFNAL